MMTDERRQWLRGAYLDRIMEAALHFSEGRTHFVDAEWLEHGDDFQYLIELSAEDHAYLREHAGLEAWKRIRDNNLMGRKAAFGIVRADHPDAISGDVELFSFDIGWSGLARHAAERLTTYPKSWRATITGGKEKFGALVLFVSYETTQRGARSEIERLLEEIRLRSLSTCEICGESGRLRLSGYAKTVCDKHADVMGELREDDGRWADPWKWHDDQVDAELLHSMDPPIQRPTEHVIDSEFFPSPIRATDIGRRIDDDTWSRSGREQELLIEFGFHILDTVQGACVKEEYLDRYVLDEIAGWRELAVRPLSESDEVFLQGYVRELIDEEYERIRQKQDAERNNK
ncbi:hypothetical protein [Shinella sp.]|uniref:hypothetical protein n=1 Tax=Shinella sp. TaxID=1870904 RepID=UPI0039E3A202